MTKLYGYKNVIYHRPLFFLHVWNQETYKRPLGTTVSAILSNKDVRCAVCQHFYQTQITDKRTFSSEN